METYSIIASFCDTAAGQLPNKSSGGFVFIKFKRDKIHLRRL